MQPLRLSRRKFLTGAATVASGAAALGFPAIVQAQGAISFRFQSAWPSKDIFHECAQDFAKVVSDMTGGDLRVEVLSAGAVVPALGLLEAVSKGALDGSHGALIHAYDRSSAFALWGCGPAFGMDGNMMLAWHKWGGGKELLAKLYASVGANVVSFPYAPLSTQPLGWFKKRITRPEDFKGLKYRAVGISTEVFAAMGATVKALPAEEIAPAMDRDQLDAAEFSNTSSDRMLGLADVSKICMLQSYHQNAEQLEINFNKTKYDGLPAKLKAILANAVDAASAQTMWKLIDRNSKDYVALQQVDKVHFYRTPSSVLKKQLEAYDRAAAAKMSTPLFGEIVESQRKFAERAVKWDLDVVVPRDMAYSHYFAKNKPAGKKV